MTGGDRTVGILTLGALLVGVPAEARAQDAVKMRTVDVPRIGRQAPEVILPYVTRQGPGPVDQPFRLSAELGRVVVLLFHAGDGFLGELTGQVDSLLGRNGVLAVVTPDSAEGIVDRATRLALPYKSLTDGGGEVSRRFGFGNRVPGDGGVAWVVSPLGKMTGRVTGLRTGNPAALAELGRLVEKSRKE